MRIVALKNGYNRTTLLTKALMPATIKGLKRHLRQFPEEVVSRMLGHNDPTSTRMYANLNADQVRATLVRQRK